MPIPTPFDARTAPLCQSWRWKDWAGYRAVCSYEYTHDVEYFAFRESAGLLDVSPLFKYEVKGPDAAKLLSRMTVRDVMKLKVGRVLYSCWCDDEGKVIDDGTISRLEPDHYRLTSADPALHWLMRLSRGMNVSLEDSSAQLAVLALQGPMSRDILKACSDANLNKLSFFGITPAKVNGIAGWISRTGYTGDLGYEIWVQNADAIGLWDTLMQVGRPYGIVPAGLDALDMVRIEAGFVLMGIDYYSAPKVLLESRKSTPFELGFGWMVDLERDPFIGQKALQLEKVEGSSWSLVGLEASWEELEALYERYGLPPHLPAKASRDGLPVYADGCQVGMVTSHTWSPLLKKYIAIASLKSPVAHPYRRVQLEHTVEFERHTISATVTTLPFFNPERKRKP